MSGYEQHLSRGLQEDIDNTPIIDGKLRFSVDQARIFMDLVNERVEFTDFVKGLTSTEIVALTNPLPKIYLTSDTHQFMMYHAGEWITYGGGALDSRGQEISETYIKDVKYNDEGKLVKVLGNGEEEEISSSTVITNRIATLENTVDELLHDIEIIKNQL